MLSSALTERSHFLAYHLQVGSCDSGLPVKCEQRDRYDFQTKVTESSCALLTFSLSTWYLDSLVDLEEGGAASWHEPGSLNDCIEPRSLLLLTSQHPSNLEWDVLSVIHKLLYLATNDFLTYYSVTTVQCTVLYITVHVLYCNNGLPCPLCVCVHTHACTHTLTQSWPTLRAYGL